MVAVFHHRRSDIPFFIKSLLAWYETEKRDLPWRKTSDPYKIWVSEVFLQQTQVSRVIFYYERFLDRFPTVESLANASWEEFLPYFQGLGFYSRGKNMLKAAKYIVEECGGKFPLGVGARLIAPLQRIPGVGPYTAAAIASFAFGENVPAIDTNFIRVFSRFYGIEKKAVQQKANEVFGRGAIHRAPTFNHAIMDLGSSLCTAKKTKCEDCPLQKECWWASHLGQLPAPTVSRPRQILDEEYAILVLYSEGKYLFYPPAPLIRGVPKAGGNFYSLPSFPRPKGKDIRHLLKEKALEEWGIHISVRPPFFTTDIKTKGKIIRLSFSRAQILDGKKPEGKNLLWISPQNFLEYGFDEFSEKVLSRLQKMKLPS